MSYWIDSNVLIQAKAGPYKFDRVPEFWMFLAVNFESGVIRSSEFVYKELTIVNDDLGKWCKSRRQTSLNTKIDEEVQRCYVTITDYIEQLPLTKHNVNRRNEFYACADGWLIAHAMAEGGIVVTHETPRDNGKIKIPSICDALGVKWINLYDMQDDLDFRVSDYASV